MNKNKQLAINMTAQIIAFGVNLLIGFFLTPFIVENVGKEAYGFVGLANNFISYAAIITVALNSMAGRFITISIHQKRYEDTNKYFTSVFFANVMLSIPITVASVFILLFLDKLVNVPANILLDVRILWGMLFFNFIIGLIGTQYSTATFSQNRLELSSIRSIESNLLRVAVLLIAFCFFKPSVWYLGLSTVLCGLYVFATNVYYTKKLLPNVKINKKYFDFSKVKELVFSGIWNSISRISSTLATGLDLLITNLFISASAMGIVSISKVLPTYILSAFGVISGVFAPQLTISYAKNETEDMKRQILSSIRLLGFFACIPTAFLYVFSKDFFHLWMPGQDANVLYILTILTTLEFPATLPLEPLWNVFTVTNKIKQSSIFLMITSFISIGVVFTVLNFTQDEMIKMYAIVGVSTIIGTIRNITFLPLYGAKCLNLKWYTFYPTIIRNLFVVIISTGVAFLIKQVIHINSWFTLIVAVLVMSIIACVINYFIMLRQEERKKLCNVILRRNKK